MTREDQAILATVVDLLNVSANRRDVTHAKTIRCRLRAVLQIMVEHEAGRASRSARTRNREGLKVDPSPNGNNHSRRKQRGRGTYA
jgi:hypothetical protein